MCFLKSSKKFQVLALKGFTKRLERLDFVLVGAGLQTNRILTYLNPTEPLYIVDSAKSKWGMEIGKFKVFPTSRFSKGDAQFILISTLNYFGLVRDFSAVDHGLSFAIAPLELIYGYS